MKKWQLCRSVERRDLRRGGGVGVVWQHCGGDDAVVVVGMDMDLASGGTALTRGHGYGGRALTRNKWWQSFGTCG